MSDMRALASKARIVRLQRTSGTLPELIMRAVLRRSGVPFVPNDKRLPGSPDLAVWSTRTAIFVHGCFWHGHGCTRAAIPLTDRAYWAKMARNKLRDIRVSQRLEAMGWRVIVLWECAIERRYLRRIVR